MDKREMANDKTGPEENKEERPNENPAAGSGGGNLHGGEETDDERKASSSGGTPKESLEGPIRLTKLAAEKIKEITKAEGLENSRLRFKVVGGGCAGFSYDMAFDEKTVEEDGETKRVFALAEDPVSPMDIKIVIEGVTVVVDQMSMMYLIGTEIDYVDELQATGFKFNNPNVKNTCGCGSSFS